MALRGNIAIIGYNSEFACVRIDDASPAQDVLLPQTIGSYFINPLDIVHLEKESLITYNSKYKGKRKKEKGKGKRKKKKEKRKKEKKRRERERKTKEITANSNNNSMLF